jgi:OmcA/MtrC family decaheme c-type cytochrome
VRAAREANGNPDPAEDEMTSRWRGAAILAAAAAAAMVVTGACGKSRKTGNGGGGDGGTPAVNEQVVAPYGFKLQITGATIPADPTAAATPPTVTFTVSDDKGAPVDLKAELQKAPPAAGQPAGGYPYVNAPRFTLARLDPDGLKYQSLYMNAANNQAVSVTLPRDPAQFDQRVTSNGNGSYTFKLDPLKANPSADERGRTFTAGTWGSRRTSQDEGEDEAATSTFHFVPAGGNATSKQVVALGACNTCHGPAVRAHGTRLGTQLCLTCHTSQTSDPDTGNSVEFVELVHKIHYGGDRPGPTYTIIGFNNATHAYDQAWINDVRNCTMCHQGANADRHLAAPSLRACSTCHTIVKFDGSASATCQTGTKDAADCNHQGGPQAANASCNGCHTADKLKASHTSIMQVADQFKYDIQSVTVGQDRKPVVRFAVRDASNNPRDLENDPAYKQPASSLNLQFAWPSKEFTNNGTASTTPAPGQPRSVAVVRAGQFQAATATKVQGQTGVYEVTSPVALPSDVTSATVFMDGHPVQQGENIPVVNAFKDFGATGGPGEPRRKVVDVANCNKCHGVVSAHGRNRNGSIETCHVCHNPRATDWQKRQGTEGAGSESPIDFKVMIHGVHAADIRQDPMVIYGFNGANAATGGAPGLKHEFPGDMPHGVANCTLCHAGATYEPPLPAEALDTTIDTNNTPLDQSDDKTMPKTIAVCTACHDQVHFDAASSSLPACGTLADVNSKACFHSGGPQTGDAACASCHGKGGAADVQRVHNVQ